jgi:hypothetical protein
MKLLKITPENGIIIMGKSAGFLNGVLVAEEANS